MAGKRGDISYMPRHRPRQWDCSEHVVRTSDYLETSLHRRPRRLDSLTLRIGM